MSSSTVKIIPSNARIPKIPRVVKITSSILHPLMLYLASVLRLIPMRLGSIRTPKILPILNFFLGLFS
jgi:hypothetical protein